MVTGKTSCPTAHGKFMSNLIAACSLRDKDSLLLRRKCQTDHPLILSKIINVVS